MKVGGRRLKRSPGTQPMRIATRIAILIAISSMVLFPIPIVAGPELQMLDRPANCAGHAMTVSAALQLDLASLTATALQGYIYQAGFDAAPFSWDGKLSKMAIRSDPSGEFTAAVKPGWEASALLTGPYGKPGSPTPDERRIYTMRADASLTTATIEFKWPALDPAQQAWLDASSANGMPDGLGERRLQYLRGHRDLEAGNPGGMFRKRRSPLGDIDWSSPVLVGPPATNGQGDAYRQFNDKNQKRKTAVYVGANDGMLHAFNADDGRELFAYIPRALLPRLNALTVPQAAHRPYVDGRAITAEAQARGQWMTVLASGMGGGARGVFALDVSNPDDFFGGAGALWEFTDADDRGMGYLPVKPLIAKFRLASASGESGYRYFVVVPGGLNPAPAQGAAGAGGAAALFLLSLDKAVGEPWRSGTNYFKFVLSAAAAALPNGLGTPALVTDGDGAVRYAYVGDLQGNLWRFDFGNAAWPISSINAAINAASNAKRIFTARDASGVRQPISMAPSVAYAPGGGYIVMFGTGKYLEAPDVLPASSGMQSFYGIHDALGDAPAVDGRAELTSRTLEREGAGYRMAGDAFTFGDGKSDRKGWYFDFADSARTGERVVSEATSKGGLLVFNSLIPEADICAPAGGRTYVLDVLTGLSPSPRATGVTLRPGLIMPPVILETPLQVSANTPIGRRTETRRSTVVSPGPDGLKQVDAIESIRHVGRLGWREIVNWQELRYVPHKN